MVSVKLKSSVLKTTHDFPTKMTEKAFKRFRARRAVLETSRLTAAALLNRGVLEFFIALLTGALSSTF